MEDTHGERAFILSAIGTAMILIWIGAAWWYVGLATFFVSLWCWFLWEIDHAPEVGWWK